MENKVLKLGGEIHQRCICRNKNTPPAASNDTPILSSRFNPTRKYPLDLNFYWVSQSQLNTRIKIISPL
jgi:hypothetical protein